MRVVVEERDRGEKQGKMEEKRQRDSYTVTMGKNHQREMKGGCMQYTAKRQTITVSFKGTKLGKQNNNTFVKYNSSVAQL